MKVFFLFATVVLPAHLMAQRLAPVPAYAMASTHATHFDRVRADSAVAIPPTYWLEGGVIGAVSVGVLGTLWFRGLSDTRPSLGSTILGAAICSAVGFGPGALIGGQFRKSRVARRPSN